MIMSGNEAPSRNVFRRWRKVDRDGAEITLSGRLLGGSGDWEGPAADGRQFDGRPKQTIGPSRGQLTLVSSYSLKPWV